MIRPTIVLQPIKKILDKFKKDKNVTIVEVKPDDKPSQP